MSTQRYISTSFWDDEWVQTLNLTEKALYLYFMTNTLTNIAGVYKISDRRILFDTGLSEAEFKSIFDKFQNSGKAYRIGEYIALPKWAKHQKWENHDKIKKGIEAVLKELPPDVLQFLLKIKYEFPLENIAYDSLSKKNIAYDSLSSAENPKTLPFNYSDLDLDLNSDTDTNSDTDSGTDNPQSLFLYYWQHNPDIFDFQARIESYEKWEKFWKQSHVTCSQIDTAMNNFILDVREGIIERKYIPLLPDRFILNGWLTKCQERLKPDKPKTEFGKSLLEVEEYE